MSDDRDILAAIEQLPDNWTLSMGRDGTYQAHGFPVGRHTFGSIDVWAEVRAAQNLQWAIDNGSLAVRRSSVQQDSMFGWGEGRTPQGNGGMLDVSWKRRKKGRTKAIREYKRSRKR